MEGDFKRNGPPLGRAARNSLILLFASFLPAALPRQRFFHTLFFARLQVKGVTLNLLDDVFLLHFTLETAQCIFEGFSLLQSNFGQRTNTPKLVPFGAG